MELDDETQYDLPTKPLYPYGLRICLTQDELTKLGLDSSCEPGDYLHLQAFATVTSVTKDENCRRVELQIEKLAAEDELSE